jgi:hypothetical protein
VNDDMTREVLGAVKAAIPDARMPTPVQHIVSTARSRRRRRGLAKLAACGLAAAASLTLGLGLSAAGAGRSAPTAHQGGSKLAAWTVHTSPDGIVTITLRQLANPAVLQHVLAAHGVPAIVRAGDSICFERDGQPLPGLFRVVSHPQGSHPIVIRIRPAAMPSGSELLFSITRISGVVQYVGQELIHTGAPVSCLHPPTYPRSPASRHQNG